MSEKIKVRVTASWGPLRKDTGEPVNVSYSDLEFDAEDIEGDQIQLWESLKITWTAIRGQYMANRYGPRWYVKEAMEKVKKSGLEWR